MGDIESLGGSLGTTLRTYTWLVVDALLFLLLVSMFLGYRDFDDKMRMLVRGAFVFSWAFFLLSGLHILIYVRRAEHRTRAPWLVSYSMFALKLAIVAGFFYWATRQGTI